MKTKPQDQVYQTGGYWFRVLGGVTYGPYANVATALQADTPRMAELLKP